MWFEVAISATKRKRVVGDPLSRLLSYDAFRVANKALETHVVKSDILVMVQRVVFIIRNNDGVLYSRQSHKQLDLVEVDAVAIFDASAFEGVPFFVVHGFDFEDMGFAVDVDHAVCVSAQVSAERGVGKLLLGCGVDLKQAVPGVS